MPCPASSYHLPESHSNLKLCDPKRGGEGSVGHLMPHKEASGSQISNARPDKLLKWLKGS